MSEIARVLDMSSWWRSGGANWNVIASQFDGVVLRAGVGTHQDVCLQEFVDACRAHKIPYATYHIPGRPSWTGMSVRAQAQLYQTWYGVDEAVSVGDIEPPMVGRYDLMLTASEWLEYFATIEAMAQHRPVWYSNLDCLNRISWPADLARYYNWAARYYYAPGTSKPYRTFEHFLSTGHAMPWWGKTIYDATNVLWQFTDYGDPVRYGAIVKKQVDLNIGTQDKATVMRALFPDAETPPAPPPQEIIMRYKIVSSGLHARIRPNTNAQSYAIMPKEYTFTGTGRMSAGPGVEFWVEWVHPVHGPVWSAAIYGPSRFLETL
jgi:hypothetical protein